MKHSEAEKLIRNALWSVQKVRSIGNELAQDDPAMFRVQRFLEPKAYDEEWMLKPLLKLVERLDNGGKITPMEFYNVMTIISKWGESVQVAYIIESENLDGFPEPNAQWLRGWEAES